MGEFDRSSKWLIQHHGDALLRLAGYSDFTWWRPLQAEVVQPAQLPDGLLEVQLRDKPAPSLVVLEIATYPERRLEEQLLGDALLVRMSRRALPNVAAIVLRPKGKYRVPDRAREASDLEWTELALKWRVVELWKQPAKELLALEDPGIIPWVPLMHHSSTPERIFQRCSEIIRDNAPPHEQTNLLAVTQVLARLRYNDPALFQILGGRVAMIESPLLDEIRAESRAEGMAKGKTEALVSVLSERFGSLPAALEQRVRLLQDEAHLDRLIRLAARCRDLAAFDRQMDH
jgi:hypothetical protein